MLRIRLSRGLCSKYSGRLTNARGPGVLMRPLAPQPIKGGKMAMATCRECRWYKVDIGNPTKGICISQSYQADEQEAAGGTTSSVIPGKLIKGSDAICNDYEVKGKSSRAQRLKEGM